MQGDPHLTEALTRAFMFADASVANEIHDVGMRLTRMLTRAMDPERDGEATDEDIAIARVIGDVWLSALVSWVTGRGTADETVSTWRSRSGCCSATDSQRERQPPKAWVAVTPPSIGDLGAVDVRDSSLARKT